MENTNQQPNSSEIPSQNQPNQNIINNQRGNVPIIIGGILLLLIVGGGAYYLGTQRNTTPIQNQTSNTTVNQATPTQTTFETSPSPEVLTWKKQTIESNCTTSVR